MHRAAPIGRGDEVVIKAAEPFAATDFEVHDAPSVYQGKRLSLADMDRAVAAEAGKRK